MEIDFSGRVAIITGAGGGLGRSHALMLASRGAKVVVNDISESPAQAVVDEIRDSGGDATAIAASVSDFAQVERMVARVMDTWGRIDILVNNAGILKDKTFTKMTMEDFWHVVEVHLMGGAYCSKAVWDIMRAQNYGRIVMTTSPSGLFGNFGQANYSAAKAALVGLMQTLAIEGKRYNIRVNSLAPTAATAMTADVMPPAMLAALHPGLVSPGLIALVADDAPTKTILSAGGGSFEQVHIVLTKGVFVGSSRDAAEQISGRWHEIGDLAEATLPRSAMEQAAFEMKKAGFTSAEIGEQPDA